MIKDVPSPLIKCRPVNLEREKQAKDSGLDPILAKIIASRPFLKEESPEILLSPKLKMLDNPETLVDIDKAVARLILALENNEIIGIETDHDCDGQTSHAVIYVALTNFFKHPSLRVRSYIGHRLKEGYGLSEAVVTRILADEPRPTLVITADNGSSDEPRIAQLKRAGIDVIVTDHHEIPPEGPPQSAFAVINPVRTDCYFPDRYIAGCMVAWLLMAATRQKLMVNHHRIIPSLAQILDFVAVGTIADCVSIARSKNNRAVVSYGMKLIQEAKRPCWRALLPFLSFPLSSEDLGFKIGPLLNSDGRLACAFGSVSFLLAPDDIEAGKWVAHLQIQNTQRKLIQEKVTLLALAQAKAQYLQGKISLCLFLEEGHAGVHGISASRIKDMFGRPVIILCPKADTPEILTGSARSIEGIHLRDVLQAVQEHTPMIMERFGGHQGAAGLTLKRENLPQFIEIFEAIIKKKVLVETIGPVVWTDGMLPLDKLNLPFITSLMGSLEPFGREFEPPLFEIQGKVLSLSWMGQDKTHARLGLAVGDLWFEAVWFKCRANQAEPEPVGEGMQVKVVFSPKLQTYKGQRQLSCQVICLEIL